MTWQEEFACISISEILLTIYIHCAVISFATFFVAIKEVTGIGEDNQVVRLAKAIVPGL